MMNRKRLSRHPYNHYMCQVYGNRAFTKLYLRKTFNSCKSLPRKDLFGHFGCVNAIEFSKNGLWLASGGDDRRVLLWSISEALSCKNDCFEVMKTQHMSNIFCTIYDLDTKHIFSSGNDEQIVRHNIETKEAVGFFEHEEAVYSLSQPSDNCNILASASEDGTVLLWDIRTPQEKSSLCTSTGSFHGVAFNPVDSRLIAAADSYDGVLLFDVRVPQKIILTYGASPQLKNAMSVRFNYTGRLIYSLYRKSGPVIFNLHETQPVCIFDDPGYSNICTMKSACFAGDTDQFVVSGSDNFSVYIWKIPDPLSSVKKVDKALLELQGHRSIVNQVRYSDQNMLLASAGVEKIVKLWSPFQMAGCAGNADGTEKYEKRGHYSHEEYLRLILQSGQPLTHDYNTESTEEDPRMIAFFDSLIHRVNDDWSSDNTDSESSMDGIFQMLINQPSGDSDQEQRTDETESENVTSTATIAELRRLFRSNRRLLMLEIGIDSSSSEDEESSTVELSSNISETRTFDNSPGLEIVRSNARGLNGPSSHSGHDLHTMRHLPLEQGTESEITSRSETNFNCSSAFSLSALSTEEPPESGKEPTMSDTNSAFSNRKTEDECIENRDRYHCKWSSDTAVASISDPKDLESRTPLLSEANIVHEPLSSNSRKGSSTTCRHGYHELCVTDSEESDYPLFSGERKNRASPLFSNNAGTISGTLSEDPLCQENPSGSSFLNDEDINSNRTSNIRFNRSANFRKRRYRDSRQDK